MHKHSLYFVGYHLLFTIFSSSLHTKWQENASAVLDTLLRGRQHKKTIGPLLRLASALHLRTSLTGRLALWGKHL